MYSVKEIFYTLQGEGFHAGRAAVFLRFAGCNLWSGREEDRKAAVCRFCDTNFVGTDGENGGKFTAEALASRVCQIWNTGVGNKINKGKPFVVCTGGEPLLQLDRHLSLELRRRGFEVAVETNGTVLPKDGTVIDWVCVSPKGNAEVKIISGHELKLVYPQLERDPTEFSNLDFKHFYISPRDVSFQWPDHLEMNAQNMSRAAQYCMENPQWKLSLQTHKILGLK